MEPVRTPGTLCQNCNAWITQKFSDYGKRVLFCFALFANIKGWIGRGKTVRQALYIRAISVTSQLCDFEQPALPL